MTFYAHYDKQTGAILAVGGHKLPDDFPDALVAELDDKTALSFIKHERDMTEWFIDPNQSKLVLTQNLMDMVPHDVGTYIEVPRGDIGAMGIRATAILSDDSVEFTIPENYKGKTLENLDREVIAFTLTKRNDPSYVVATFDIDMAQLMKDGAMVFDCSLEFKDYSLFTTKQFYYYQFEVVNISKTIGRKVASSRQNTLKVYRSGVTEAGISATYDEATQQIELEVVGKTKLTWPNADRCLLFITKPNDPTIVFHALPFDVESFWQNKRISLKLPKELNQAFGVASFPLSDDLVFNRKSNGKRKKRNN